MSPAILEGVANNPLDTFSCIDVFLDCHLVGRALLEHSAGIDINALRILTDDNEIHIARVDSFQGTKRGVHKADRAHIRVQVHFEAQTKQDFLGMDIRGDPRISKCADQDRIKIATEHGKAVRWNGHSIREVAVRAPIKRLQGQRNFSSLQDPNCLCNYLSSDPVSWEHCNSFFRCHEAKGITGSIASRTYVENL